MSVHPTNTTPPHPPFASSYYGLLQQMVPVGYNEHTKCAYTGTIYFQPDVIVPRRDILPPDFNIMAILQSFLKATGSGPSSLSIQHLVEVAEVPLQVPICSSLTDIVNLLASGQAPLSISKFLAGGSLIPLVKNTF